MFVKTNSKSLS